jgi:hypothetical protein
MMKRLILVFVVILLMATPAGAVFADSMFDTVIEEGETINNDVIVFDGDLEIKDDAIVTGDVIVFNGDAELDGRINGDLVIFNGDLKMGSDAAIHGDCVLLNGKVDDASSSGIRCTNIEGTNLSGFVNGLQPIPVVPKAATVPDLSDLPETPTVPPVPDLTAQSRSGNAFIDFVRAVFSSLLLGGLAFVVASAFPEHLQQVKETMRSRPVASGTVGFLTAFAVPIIAAMLAVLSALLTIICIGLLGFPIVLLLLVALLAGVAVGWIAAGTWLGQRLFKGKGQSLAMKAALGTVILTFGFGLLGILSAEWVESLLAIVVTSIGLGAVALTQFGRKSYPRQEAPAAEEDTEKISVVLETLPEDDADQAL